MGFTTPCFIRKNTPKLRKKLEELGYKKYGNPFQITDDSKLITTLDGEYVPYNVPLDDSFIDCGTNEELFLAIAALRDDTDDSQWFVYPPENSWFICVDDDINYARENIRESVQAAWFHCSHKATVEELIKHFKEKEE
ncbi:hypothetical protein [Bacteroides sp. AF32-8BH]|uniref:hypothetical protein n=1 Tax=Bacteroides sp. AF32-8BH TaxID=2302925 RepID=UPI000E4277A4|nr:hypothetical protein [Bacteroides sp. AF32-8BH]RGE77123.1 hypothetical protein DWZ47_19000 [Bacteroides sp. AF32-8BH]